MEGFEYVIVNKEREKICFGSTLARDTLPTSGPAVSPFMRRTIPNLITQHVKFNDPKSTLTKAYASKYGFSDLVSKTPRFISKKLPYCPDFHLAERLPTKQSSITSFGGVIKLSKNQQKSFPGPGAHNVEFHRWNNECHAFGNAPKYFKPVVRVICNPMNFSHCTFCARKPAGDYWRNVEEKKDICNNCMAHCLYKLRRKICQWTNSDKMELKKLKLYERVRDCSFFHTHLHTKAAITIRSPKEIKKKLQIENYLFKFHM